MSQTYNLGKVSLTPRGAYNATTTYEQLDVVTYNGSGYIVLQSVTGVVPPNPTYYQVIASKGDSGADGSAATATAGSITMLPLGSSPTVTNAGTLNTAVFNFGIPYSPVADGSVGTTKIADASVTRSKIADGAVGNDELSDGSVSYSKLGTDAKALLSNIEDVVEETFSPTSSYNAGDYVIYGTNNVNNSLYRFTADKSVGAWDGTKVSLTNVGNELNNRVEKESFQNAGIASISYTTIFDTATVTTTQSSTYPSFHALLMDGREASRLLEYDSDYRITIDNVEYILPAQGWYVYALKNNVHTSHDIVVIGNVSLWGSDIGFYTEISDVPFFITPQTGEVEDYGIHLFTSEGGQHTVKIEKLTYNKTVFPNVLMYGGVNPPIYSMHDDPEFKDYNSLSIGGFNDLRAKRTTVAIGSKNIISSENGIALGQLNNVGGICGIAAGIRTNANNYASMSINEGTTASGRASFAANINNTASGDASSALGNNTEASGPASVAIGTRSIANHLAQFVFGRNNIADPSQAASTSLGTYVEIVGNGTSKNARSNARTLDWSGNESLAGSITLGMGTADEVTLTAAQLKQLLALL